MEFEDVFFSERLALGIGRAAAAAAAGRIEKKVLRVVFRIRKLGARERLCWRERGMNGLFVRLLSGDAVRVV